MTKEEERARRKVYNKRWYEKNRDKRIQYHRDYRAKKKAEFEAMAAELDRIKGSDVV